MSGAGDSQNDLADWEANAKQYASVSASPTDAVAATFRSFLHVSLGNVSGLSVLDLGCGSGWLSSEIDAEGGHVLGIDGSHRLLDIARTTHPGIEFIRADLTDGLPDLGGRQFDRVVAQMLLMDMGKLDQLMLDVSRCLAASGRFIFTIDHPAFVDRSTAMESPRSSDDYLEPAVRWITTYGGHRHYHRPLQWYVNLLADAGMAVVRLFEAATSQVEPTPSPTATAAPTPNLLGVVAIPVTPGLSLPVGPPSRLTDQHDVDSPARRQLNE